MPPSRFRSRARYGTRNRQYLRTQTQSGTFAPGAFVSWELLSTGTSDSALIVKNYQIVFLAPVVATGVTESIYEHGFIRYPDGETISGTDVDVSSRYVLRAKISPMINNAMSPYCVTGNFLNAITLTPDDSLHYYFRLKTGDTQTTTWRYAAKYAASARAI